MTDRHRSERRWKKLPLLCFWRRHAPMCLFSFDAIKLATNWHRRPQADIDAELLKVVQGDAWILEGGPSLLP
ncbi:hypothetical protein [Rhizobium ruizarguesonis]|uniref:hypothetical protein n=1 Tax=Rhizobium ruizarguesonis TaxID=2081791 RepID=UPI0010DD4804|nr:hypothetical protein [Rhizobium ruizarguesonis]TBF31537.1 hypothetical protein ELG93_14925 [Rhizobium ruizarguesonis]